MNRRHFIGGILATGAAAVAGGCAVYPEPGYYGPPPHAPAHGYRYRHPHGVDLAYDAGLGVYVVVGWPRYYFLDDHFYRFHRERWEISPRFRDGWRSYDHDRLPPGLRRGYPRGAPPGWNRRRDRY